MPVPEKKVRSRSPVRSAIIARFSRRKAILLQKQQSSRMDSDDETPDNLADNASSFSEYRACEASLKFRFLIGLVS
jgi:hypothetical protein